MAIPVPKPSHRRRVPKRIKRNEFDRKTRNRIQTRDNGLCRHCGAPGSQIHHVKFRSQGGRGVVTNGLLVCGVCHGRIHADRRLAEYWQTEFERRYGGNYFKDEWDIWKND